MGRMGAAVYSRSKVVAGRKIVGRKHVVLHHRQGHTDRLKSTPSLQRLLMSSLSLVSAPLVPIARWSTHSHAAGRSSTLDRYHLTSYNSNRQHRLESSGPRVASLTSSTRAQDARSSAPSSSRAVRLARLGARAGGKSASHPFRALGGAHRSENEPSRRRRKSDEGDEEREALLVYRHGVQAVRPFLSLRSHSLLSRASTADLAFRGGWCKGSTVTPPPIPLPCPTRLGVSFLLLSRPRPRLRLFPAARARRRVRGRGEGVRRRWRLLRRREGEEGRELEL